MGDPPAPRESQCRSRRRARRPRNDRRSARADDRPRRRRPAGRGTHLQAPADFHVSSALHALQDRDSHPPGSASTPRRCHSILPHHRGWHHVENIPLRLSYSCLFHCSSHDSDQARCPRDTHVHQYHAPLSPTLPHSAGSPASPQYATGLPEAPECLTIPADGLSTTDSTPRHRASSPIPPDDSSSR